MLLNLQFQSDIDVLNFIKSCTDALNLEIKNIDNWQNITIWFRNFINEKSLFDKTVKLSLNLNNLYESLEAINKVKLLIYSSKDLSFKFHILILLVN